MKKLAIAIVLAGGIATPALAQNQLVCEQVVAQDRAMIEELIHDGIAKYHFQSPDQFPQGVKNMLKMLADRLSQDIVKWCKES